jgi:hypothetical protein
MAARVTIRLMLLTLAFSIAQTGADANTVETPAPSPEPSASPAPEATPRLTLDIVRHVDDLLFKEPNLPHFEENVEVVSRSDQAALIRAFRGIDLCNGATATGAPTAYEMRAMGPHPASPTLDLTAAVQALGAKLAAKSSGEDRFFLYRARLPEGTRYFLHEGRIPASSLYGPAGLSFELVQSFNREADAARAWRQLDRGLDWKAEEDPADAPVPVWATTPCRAGRTPK